MSSGFVFRLPTRLITQERCNLEILSGIEIVKIDVLGNGLRTANLGLVLWPCLG